MFSVGSKGCARFNERAVAGMSCMSPMAPLRETARGLKFDSTLITARTSSASTLCRAAAASIAAFTFSEVTKVEADSVVGGVVLEAEEAGSVTVCASTSAAAVCARSAVALVNGTGFQRCAVLLQ